MPPGSMKDDWHRAPVSGLNLSKFLTDKAIERFAKAVLHNDTRFGMVLAQIGRLSLAMYMLLCPSAELMPALSFAVCNAADSLIRYDQLAQCCTVYHCLGMYSISHPRVGSGSSTGTYRAFCCCSGKSSRIWQQAVMLSTAQSLLMALHEASAQ